MIEGDILPLIVKLRRAAEALAKRKIPVRRVIFAPYLPRPLIEVGNTGNREGMVWHRYAWGHDERGHWACYAALLHDCQIKREVKSNGI